MTPWIRRALSRALVSLGLVAAVTGVIALLDEHTRTSSLAMLYLLAVLPVALLWGFKFAVGMSVACTAAFDYLFVPPRHTFASKDSADWIGLAAFLVTALVVSILAARSQQRARESARLADEQAALGRVATLVARGVPPDDVFAAVATEVGLLIPAIETTAMLRYEADGTATVMARWSTREAQETLEAASRELGIDVGIGARVTLDGENVPALVLRTEQPARNDDEASGSGPFATLRRNLGMRSTVGAPIVVDGRLWGVMLAAWSRPVPLPGATGSRLAQFTGLVAAAISNAKTRAELVASRARIVTAADESRRRIERDLHDGTQQRLVSLAFELRTAEATAPAAAAGLRGQLRGIAEGLTGAVKDLQEISRGIHPAILSKGGLEPALKALARRSSLPVELDAGPVARLPEPLEMAAYYVVSEALANATKHASASVAEVLLEVRDAMLHISIRDDGAGGADPSQGSGLLGLTDRVAALGGTIVVTSPPGKGTSIVVELPVSATA